MKKIYLLALIHLFILPIKGQIVSNFLKTLSVTENNQSLSIPFSGGLNSPQFSAIDLNQDNVKDLFIYDRNTGECRTFLNNGSTTSFPYQHAPSYQSAFPVQMNRFVLLRDYNCDGQEDLFTYITGGFAVYLNTSLDSGYLHFEKAHPGFLKSDYGFGSFNLYTSGADIPAIDDIDNDGDMDILNFSVLGTQVEYHRNISMDLYGHCDSLKFELTDACWGKFAESGNSNQVVMGVSCKGITLNNNSNELLHSGSTIITFDIDNDGDKDALLGDVSYNNMVQLTNGGDSSFANITSQDTLFPSYNTPIDLIYPAAYYLDINNDDKRDLIVSTNISISGPDKTSILCYKNTHTDLAPIFEKTGSYYFQNQMIDLGSGSAPTFFDYNKDGLMDLVIGNEFFIDTATHFGRLALYKNTGSQNIAAFTLITEDYQNLSLLGKNNLCPTFGDLDGDGDEDLLIGFSNGGFAFYKDISSAGVEAQFLEWQNLDSNLNPGNSACPDLFDIDEDGDLDLITGTQSGEIILYRNIGSSVNPIFSENDNIGDLGNIVTGLNSSVYLVDNDSLGIIMYTVSGNKTLEVFSNIEGNINGTYTKIDSLDLNIKGLRVSGAPLFQKHHYSLCLGQKLGGINILEDQVDTPSSSQTKNMDNAYFSVFPNPLNHELNIHTKNIAHPFQVIVYDPIGKIIYSNTFNTPLTKINTSKFTPGVYSIQIISAQYRLSKSIIKIQ